MGRYLVLAAATVASLSCGLNYCFSAYAPQLATRLHLTSTQLNTVGAAGNLGVYLSSPFIGRIVDKNGPKPTLVFAAVALTSGYLIIRAFYTTGDVDGDHRGWYAIAGVPGLVAAQLLTGMGSTAGLSSVGNSVAKSFRKRRAAALSVVLSGFGLSAFLYSTLASILLHPRTTPGRRIPNHSEDSTSGFLLLLAVGSLLSMLVGLAFVRPIHRPPPAPAVPALAENPPQWLGGGARTTGQGFPDDDDDDDEEEGREAEEVEFEPPFMVVSTPEYEYDNDVNDEYDPVESGVTIKARRRRTSSNNAPPSADRTSQPGGDTAGATEQTPLLFRQHQQRDTEQEDEIVATTTTDRNITGWALLREVDFYLIFVFNGLCAGVGLCYINNLGTIVRSLSLPLGIAPSRVAADQARLVSLLSVFNCAGRLVSGFGSDYLLHHRRRLRRRRRHRDCGRSAVTEPGVATTKIASSSSSLPNTTPTPPTHAEGAGEGGGIPRVFFLPVTSVLFFLSQLALVATSSTSEVRGGGGGGGGPRRLWIPTALTGLAHGCLFGLSGIIGLERFGIRNFSQTNGVLALAPALFGQATNLIFGRIYDSHLVESSSSSFSSFELLDLGLGPGGGGPTCTAGRACFIRATYLTCGMSLAATAVGLVLALARKEMRTRAV
ncbi:hypothetical protein JCM3774_000879 [Rhodotorula dairenensis]